MIVDAFSQLSRISCPGTPVTSSSSASTKRVGYFGSGGFSAQNVAVWFDKDGAHAGTLNELVRWCGGQFLLLVFGRIPGMDVPRLRDLASHFPVRIVQVLGPKAKDAAQPVAVEHVYDLKGHLRQATRAQSHQWVLVRPDAYVVGGGPGGPKWRSQITALLLKATGADA